MQFWTGPIDQLINILYEIVKNLFVELINIYITNLRKKIFRFCSLMHDNCINFYPCTADILIFTINVIGFKLTVAVWERINSTFRTSLGIFNDLCQSTDFKGSFKVGKGSCNLQTQKFGQNLLELVLLVLK